jgi:hypothetical protein
VKRRQLNDVGLSKVDDRTINGRLSFHQIGSFYDMADYRKVKFFNFLTRKLLLT